MPVLRSLQQQQGIAGKFGVAKKNFEDLQREIGGGKCHLMRDVAGTVVRIVSLIVLHLSRLDGLICVRLANWREGGGTADFALPGTKIRSNELPEDAVYRFIHENL